MTDDTSNDIVIYWPMKILIVLLMCCIIIERICVIDDIPYVHVILT